MKKFLAVILALCLAIGMMVCAYAEAIPSKTTNDQVVVEQATYIDAAGVEQTGGLLVEDVDDTDPTIAEEPQVAVLTAPLATAAALEEGTPVTGIIDESVTAEMEIPENVELNEYVLMRAAGYESDMGDVKVVLEVATVYTADQQLFAFIGVTHVEGDETEDENGDGIDWYPVELTVNAEDGSKLELIFTQEIMEIINNNFYVLAIFNTPVVE